MLSSAVADRIDAAALATEALCLLLAAAALRRSMPMSRWAGLLGTPQSPTDTDRVVGAPASGKERDIGLAVARVAARLPYRATCLDRVTAAQVMLRRRGQPGVAVIGLAPVRQWDAHAWLVGSTGIIVGLDEAARFTPATIFR